MGGGRGDEHPFFWGEHPFFRGECPRSRCVLIFSGKRLFFDGEFVVAVAGGGLFALILYLFYFKAAARTRHVPALRRTMCKKLVGARNKDGIG